MLLRVTVPKVKSHGLRWWKTFESRSHNEVSVVVERVGDTGIERAEAAKGTAWLQWRKVAREKH